MTSVKAPRETLEPATDVRAPALIGHFVPEILSLAKRGLLWAVLYGVVARASAGGCLSPDAAADPVCYSVTLNPSPLVWLAMALVFVMSVARAAQAGDTGTITRVLSRAATAMWLIPAVVAVASIWSFATTSPEAWFHGTPPPNVTVQLDIE